MPRASLHVQFSLLVSVAFLLALPATADGEPFERIVNMSGKFECSLGGGDADPLLLPAGTFEFEPIGPESGGLYVSMNPWGGVVVDCDAEGRNCRKGWRWLVSYRLGNGEAEFFGSEVAFSTPEASLQSVLPIEVRLDQPTELRMWFEDTPCGDNHEGVSIRIRVATAAPTEGSSWSRIKGLFR